MKKQILLMVCATALLSSCRIYSSYDRPDVTTSGLYRDTASVNDTLAVTDTTNMGNLPWTEVFTDPKLQALIQKGLENNTDLLSASLKVKQAEAMLTSARLSFLPSFALTPQGTVSSFDHAKATQTYQLPVSASWEVDLFGKLLNAERSKKALLLQSKAYQQAVKTRVIASIANTYYTLLMLDKQLEISLETAEAWKQSVETTRKLMTIGSANESAVSSTEANYLSVQASLAELRRQIRETENSLSLLLGQVPQTVDRGRIDEQELPAHLATGVPVQLLANRPDVKQSEMSLASAYYVTNQAYSAFYPSLTITGALGWTNSAGAAILNPGKMIASAVGSLTQPLFNKGQLIANLKVAKAQQEEALLAFQYSLLNAGSEVSNALVLYNSSTEKSRLEADQVRSLERVVSYTQQLFNLGSASYLEVLTAQKSLLGAQLSKVSDDFYRMQAVVNLYYALGGGR
ncbi:MAG TPA: efflux transporter outer membrane subunit [Bacteroides graminisolvens]|jgi:NodT family efflux transporter outer membrane factor (OMF) lipoprotein|nr:efflux transporter outer membrane subunit [Bacteroides graminisolvens]